MLVLETTKMRTLPVLNKAVDLAPATQACCGVCRSCMSTNIMSALAAGTVFAGAPFVRVAKRLRQASARVSLAARMAQTDSRID